MNNVVAFPTPNHPLPDYTEHRGRAITWEPWQVSAQITCLGPRECEHCGSTDTPLFTAGRAAPLPGETFTSWEPRRRGHEEGMAVKQVEVPAWSVYQLHALRCPRCHKIDVIDITDDYRAVDIDNPTLF